MYSSALDFRALQSGFLSGLAHACSVHSCCRLFSVSHLAESMAECVTSYDLFCSKFWNSIPRAVLGILGGQSAPYFSPNTPMALGVPSDCHSLNSALLQTSCHSKL